MQPHANVQLDKLIKSFYPNLPLLFFSFSFSPLNPIQLIKRNPLTIDIYFSTPHTRQGWHLIFNWTMRASGVCIARGMRRSWHLHISQLVQGPTTVAMAIIARLGVNIAANIGFQYAAEMLPTVVRAQGVSLIHIIGYIAHILGPYIIYLVSESKFLLTTLYFYDPRVT